LLLLLLLLLLLAAAAAAVTLHTCKCQQRPKRHVHGSFTWLQLLKQSQWQLSGLQHKSSRR